MENWFIGIIILCSIIVLYAIKKWFEYKKVAVASKGYAKTTGLLYLFLAFMALTGVLSISDKLLDWLFSKVGIDFSNHATEFKLFSVFLFVVFSITTFLILKKEQKQPNYQSNNNIIGNIKADNVTITQNINTNNNTKTSSDDSCSNQEILKIQPTELPHTESYLIGREDELSLLDKAWDTSSSNIVIFQALGGAGKTALINNWVDTFHDKNAFRGANKIFKYPFYTRGSSENFQSSADDFFEEALRVFGYQGDRNLSAHAKGLILAKLINQQKTLLILDGLEPLQHHVNILNGELKDRGLRSLLLQLASDNKGLCVITTRQSIIEVKSKPLVISKKLKRLKTPDGIALLKNIGVKGIHRELEKAVDEVEGHALALNLLGGFILDAYDGDIRQRDKIPSIFDDPSKGSHAKNIMAAYEMHLKGTPELHILYLLSLFSRPASREAFEILLQNPLYQVERKILRFFKSKEKQRQKFNIKLKNFSGVMMGKFFRNLRQYALLNKEELSIHPLVKEYFSKRLREQYPDVWNLSHIQLYEYYKAVPEDEFPDTLKKIEPLIAAVHHACSAQLFDTAFKEVYHPRILGEYEDNLTRRLGAYGLQLTLLSDFFEVRWEKPVEHLDNDIKANILSGTAICLRALGRYKEAETPLGAVLKQNKKEKYWGSVAENVVTLSTLQLIQGQISLSIETASLSLEYIKKMNSKSAIYFQKKIVSHSAIGYAFFQSGNMTTAQSHFIKAEEYQKKYDPDHPKLYSTRGFNYCNFLIAKGNWKEVKQRAKQNLQWWANDFTNGGLFDLALDPLLSCRVNSLEMISIIIKKNISQVASNIYSKNLQTDSIIIRIKSPTSIQSHAVNTISEFFKTVIDNLRKAGAEEFTIQGLHARAKFYRFLTNFKKAENDLQEMFELVQFGNMRLSLADLHLESCRLAITANKSILGLTSFEHLQEVKMLIEETGYKRSKMELKYLEELLATR